MSSRKDQVRYVGLYTIPQKSMETFEQQFGGMVEAFVKLPIAQKNITKLEFVGRLSGQRYLSSLTCRQTLSNGEFDGTLQSLGLPKSTSNLMVIVEAEVNDVWLSFFRCGYLKSTALSELREAQGGTIVSVSLIKQSLITIQVAHDPAWKKILEGAGQADFLATSATLGFSGDVIAKIDN